MKKVGIVGHFGFGHDLLNGQTIKVKILFQEFQKQLGNENIVAVDTHGGAKKVPAMITSTIKMFRQCENCMVLPAYKGVLFLRRCFRYLIKFFTVKHIILLLAVGLTVIWINTSGLKTSSKIIQQSVLRQQQ